MQKDDNQHDGNKAPNPLLNLLFRIIQIA